MITVYFDMDGVVADFNGYCEQLGINRLDKNTKWEQIKNTEKFFLNLPQFSEGIHSVLKVFQMKEVNDIIFLTAYAVEIPESASEKELWKQRVFGKYNFETILVSKKKLKKRLSNGIDFLIDDNEDNIREWGDRGFLFTPQTKSDEVVEFIKRKLNEK